MAMTRLIVERRDDRISTSLKTVAVLGHFLETLCCINSGKKKTPPTCADSYPKVKKESPPPPSKSKVAARVAKVYRRIIKRFDFKKKKSASPEFYYLKVDESHRHLSYEAIMKVIEDHVKKQSCINVVTQKIEVNEKGKTSHTSEKKNSSVLRDPHLEAVDEPFAITQDEVSVENEGLSKFISTAGNKELMVLETGPSEHSITSQDNRVEVGSENLSIPSERETTEPLTIENTTESGSKAASNVNEIWTPSHDSEKIIRDAVLAIIPELAEFCLYQDLVHTSIKTESQIKLN